MAINDELISILDADELKLLVDAASEINGRELLERDIRRRGAEIEFALSGAQAAVDRTIAVRRQFDEIVAESARVGEMRPARRWFAWLIAAELALSLLILLINQLLGGWPERPVSFAGLTAPLSSWAVGGFWIGFAGAGLVIAWEILVRLWYPARRRQLSREADLISVQAVEAAEAVRRRQLIDLVRDHLTEIINLGKGPTFASNLYITAGTSKARQRPLTVGVGLSEVANDDNKVATDVQRRLLKLLDHNLSGASIGISGPRGVGKSTLLTALCGANPTINGRTAIAISTSAPVEYDGREFLLHLFASLCRHVLRTEGEGDVMEMIGDMLRRARRPRRSWLSEAIPSLRAPLLFVGTGLVAIALFLSALQSFAVIPAPATKSGAGSPAGKGVSASAGSAPAPSATAAPMSGTEIDQVAMLKALGASPLFAFGVMAMLLGIAAYAGRLFTVFARFFWFRWLADRSVNSDWRRDLVERAREELRNIVFQRSYTSGWSGTLKIPAGLDLGTSGGLTLARQPESLPELVERFRAFVGEVARSYDSIVLIGIDELDKLKSAQQAEAFLNGVKTVFGIPRCFYLISVSEHALAAFERRGIGFRDAFDSALDDIVQLDFLSLDQSRVLLNRRILRLPDPFLQLCHMLSGGLPRDLIRQARALLECAEERANGFIMLREATAQLAARDLAARLRATKITIGSVRELPETSALLVEVARLPASGTIKEASDALGRFRTYVTGLAALRGDENGRIVLRLAEELAVYYEIVILLRRISALLSTEPGWKRATELDLANRLAGVRQALEVGVAVAEMRLAELRRTVDQAGNEIDRMVNPRPTQPAG